MHESLSIIILQSSKQSKFATSFKIQLFISFGFCSFYWVQINLGSYLVYGSRCHSVSEGKSVISSLLICWAPRDEWRVIEIGCDLRERMRSVGELEGGGGPATDSPAISKDKQHATSAFSSSQPFFSSIFCPLFVSSNLFVMQPGSMLFFRLACQPLVTESLRSRSVSQSVPL